MGDRLVCADCGTEAVNGACPDETCRRGRRTDPLAAAFTEALTAPAGPIPAGFAEDYAAELANLARSVLGAEGERRVEYAREFLDPTPHDDPIPWSGRLAQVYGEPDLTQPPPPICGHPMRWVSRTVAYGPWLPVEEEANRA